MFLYCAVSLVSSVLIKTHKFIIPGFSPVFQNFSFAPYLLGFWNLYVLCVCKQCLLPLCSYYCVVFLACFFTPYWEAYNYIIHAFQKMFMLLSHFHLVKFHFSWVYMVQIDIKKTGKFLYLVPVWWVILSFLLYLNT